MIFNTQNIYLIWACPLIGQVYILTYGTALRLHIYRVASKRNIAAQKEISSEDKPDAACEKLQIKNRRKP